MLLSVKGLTSGLIIASIMFQLRAKSYDKRDDFYFHIVNFPFICSNSLAAPAYGAYISLLYIYTCSRDCGFYHDFLDRELLVIRQISGC